MRDAPIALTLLMVLAGCSDPPTLPPEGLDDPSPETEPVDVPGPLDGPVTPPPPQSPALLLQGCEEYHASVRAPADDFSGLPSGWNVPVDDFGFATLAFIHQWCHIPGSPVPPNDTVFVFFLVEPPEELVLPNATHGGLLMAWTNDPVLLGELVGWGIVTTELHDIGTMSGNSRSGVYENHVIMGDPDFVLTLHTAGESSEMPWETLRLFELDTGGASAAFDRTRGPLDGSSGAATASLLLDTRPGDFPVHRVGMGIVATSLDVNVTLMQAPL